MRVFLIGDSTVATNDPSRFPQSGWGRYLGDHFEAGVTVENHAAGGHSTKSFWDSGRWEAVRSQLESEDHVLIQFGHNDQKADPAKHTDPYTSYQAYLRRYIRGAREKGALPTLITSVYRRLYDADGALRNSLGDYPEAARQLAQMENIPLVDLHRASGEYFERLGPEGTKEVFLWLSPGEEPNYPEGKEDNSHFSMDGARKVAELVAQALKRINHPLTKQMI